MATSTAVLAGIVIVIALISVAGLAYDLLHRNPRPRTGPDSFERERALTTLRYYRDVHDSSD